MRILILAPRLDVPFKNLGPVSSLRGPVAPIRNMWANVIDCISAEHKRRRDEVIIDERPLWQFSPDNINQENYDIIYVPHREEHSFPLAGDKARYYMQSVFPWIFYIDRKGFAGGSTLYPFSLDYSFTSDAFDRLQAYSRSGQSKFDQPSTQWNFDRDYVLFACQIPHDQTILYHSNVTVEDALTRTCEATLANKQTLVVKGHPVNPGSMVTLRTIAAKYPHTRWIDNYHIRDVILGSSCVVVVNSGTGMEALLNERPVITFGRCEYDCVTNSPENLNEKLLAPVYDHNAVKNFFNRWSDLTYDSNSFSSFRKLS